MQLQSAQANPRTLVEDTKRAVDIANKILTMPEEKESRLNIVGMHIEACSRMGDSPFARTMLEQTISSLD